MTEPDVLIDLAERCTRRVIKAEWSGEPYNHYCMKLECGHHEHASATYLRHEVICRVCLKAQLADKDEVEGPRDEPRIR